MVEEEIGMRLVIEVDAGTVELGIVETNTAELGTIEFVTTKFTAIGVEVLCKGELERGTVRSSVMVGVRLGWLAVVCGV